MQTSPEYKETKEKYLASFEWNKENILRICEEPLNYFPEFKHFGTVMLYRMLQAIHARNGFEEKHKRFLSSVASNSMNYGRLSDKQAVVVGNILRDYVNDLEYIAYLNQNGMEQ